MEEVGTLTAKLGSFISSRITGSFDDADDCMARRIKVHSEHADHTGGRDQWVAIAAHE